MSLSSFLEDNPDVREYFREAFPKPVVPRPRILLAPPRTESYWLVGTAFDYYLRWYLQHLNPHAIGNESWVADEAVELISDPRIKGWAVTALRRARRRLRASLTNGRFGRKLAVSALELARLDVLYRVGKGEEQLGAPVAPDDVEDLVLLLAILPPEDFRVRGPCLLNPVFHASELIGGADADLVLGDAIVDVKVTKDPKAWRAYFNQLIGYYLLYRLGGFADVRRQPVIRKLAVYFARYGELVTWLLAEIATETRFRTHTDWFRRRVEAYAAAEERRLEMLLHRTASDREGEREAAQNVGARGRRSL